MPRPVERRFCALPARGCLLTVRATGEGDLREESGPDLRGAGVVLSSLRRRGGRLEARVACEHVARVEAVFGEEAMELRPWEVRTVELD
jgi:hypothetical protein